MFEKRCSRFAVSFDSWLVLFGASCCVRMLLCSHVVLFDCAVLLCSMFCSHAHCCVRCFVRTSSVCCALYFISSNVPCLAVAVLFDVVFDSCLALLARVAVVFDIALPYRGVFDVVFAAGCSVRCSVLRLCLWFCSGAPDRDARCSGHLSD